MQKTSRVQLDFESTSGDIIRLSVPRAKHDLDGPATKTAMEEIIASNGVRTEKGKPIDINAARLVTSERTRLF